ncbi:hypothetical protein [Paraeggerthella hongkongensis]|uniref:Uncharacterized protein n=1 Tax=Paraeggerthella hongkongensis TaxID=230658 RepID=A0A3N0BCM3_9ACTN|nr:hypothetical protein [Paraeggerthella hongkongensis]RNL44757.1 hypothetical protein DMP08_06080 [Paraeggerthella hongkongensis]
MPVKKEARPAVGSKRATDQQVVNSITRAVKYDMVRQRRDEWERGMRLLPVPFAAMLAAYAVMLACGVGA